MLLLLFDNDVAEEELVVVEMGEVGVVVVAVVAVLADDEDEEDVVEDVGERAAFVVLPFDKLFGRCFLKYKY